MLETTAENLWLEARYARDHRDKHIRTLTDMIRRHHSGHFPADSGPEDAEAENFEHEYVSLMLPKLVLDNPRVRIKSALAGAQQETVLGLRHALNRWARMVPLKDPLTLIALDMLFCYGVGLCRYEPRPGVDPMGASRGDDLQRWPNLYRVPPRWYFHDGLGTDAKGAVRFRGHSYPIDLDDLKRLAKQTEGYNSAVIDSLGANEGIGDLRRNRDGQTMRRNEVVLHEIWVPEAIVDEDRGPKEGYNGAIYTLAAVGSGAEFVCKPVPFWGPRSGPYTFFGAYPIMDANYPLSPLAAVEQQVRELNMHVAAANESAKRYKRIVLCSSDNPAIAQALKSNPHDYVIQVPGFQRDQVEVLEVGGVTDQMLAHIQIGKERVDRIAGMSEAQQGRPNPDVSATADSIASEASGMRTGFIRGNYLDGIVQVFRTAGWWMLWDDKFVMNLGAEAIDDMVQTLEPARVAELGLTAPTVEAVQFRGGDGSAADVDDLMDMVEIEPFSLNRLGEEAHRQLQIQGVTVAAEMAPMVAQAPWLDWPRLYGIVGDAIGMPDMRNMLDMELAAQAAQAMGQFEPESVREGPLKRLGVKRPTKPPASGQQGARGALPPARGGQSRLAGQSSGQTARPARTGA